MMVCVRVCSKINFTVQYICIYFLRDKEIVIPIRLNGSFVGRKGEFVVKTRSRDAKGRNLTFGTMPLDLVDYTEVYIDPFSILKNAR